MRFSEGGSANRVIGICANRLCETSDLIEFAGAVKRYQLIRNNEFATQVLCALLRIEAQVFLPCKRKPLAEPKRSERRPGEDKLRPAPAVVWKPQFTHSLASELGIQACSVCGQVAIAAVKQESSTPRLVWSTHAKERVAEVMVAVVSQHDVRNVNARRGTIAILLKAKRAAQLFDDVPHIMVQRHGPYVDLARVPISELIDISVSAKIQRDDEGALVGAPLAKSRAPRDQLEEVRSTVLVPAALTTVIVGAMLVVAVAMRRAMVPVVSVTAMIAVSMPRRNVVPMRSGHGVAVAVSARRRLATVRRIGAKVKVMTKMALVSVPRCIAWSWLTGKSRHFFPANGLWL